MFRDGEKHMVKDPVCGDKLDEKTAPFKTEYQGKTFYFCCEGCKNKFEGNPWHYILEHLEKLGL